jgi:hypothetical protein
MFLTLGRAKCFVHRNLPVKSAARSFWTAVATSKAAWGFASRRSPKRFGCGSAAVCFGDFALSLFPSHGSKKTVCWLFLSENGHFQRFFRLRKSFRDVPKSLGDIPKSSGVWLPSLRDMPKPVREFSKSFRRCPKWLGRFTGPRPGVRLFKSPSRAARCRFWE